MASGDTTWVPGNDGPEEVSARRDAWKRVPNRVFGFLLGADAFFVAIYALAVALHLTHTRAFALVNLDVETNPPSWYSATQYFLIAMAFILIGSKLLPYRKRASELRRLWTVLGVGMLYLSMDEGAAIHERMGRVLTRVGFKVSLHGGGQWVFFYVLLAVLLLIYVRKDIVPAWQRWRPELMIFVLGFAILAAGAVGSEMIQWFEKFSGVFHWIEIGCEEGLEMFGASFVAWSAYRILGYVMSAPPDSEIEVA